MQRSKVTNCVNASVITRNAHVMRAVQKSSRFWATTSSPPTHIPLIPGHDAMAGQRYSVYFRTVVQNCTLSHVPPFLEHCWTSLVQKIGSIQPVSPLPK